MEALATLTIPPFFQVNDVPLHLSVPLMFDTRSGDEACPELWAQLDGPLHLDMSHFSGDMGAVTQGVLESILTEQANRILANPLWAPGVPPTLCPALSPVYLVSDSRFFHASIGGTHMPALSTTPAVPDDMNWTLSVAGASLGQALETLSSAYKGPQRWSLREANSRIEGESWVLEARLAPRTSPDRWRQLRGHYQWILTDSEVSVTQTSFVQVDSNSPPLWPNVVAMRTKLKRWTRMMTRPRRVHTTAWGKPLRASIEAFAWHPDELTILGRIEDLNSPSP